MTAARSRATTRPRTRRLPSAPRSRSPRAPCRACASGTRIGSASRTVDIAGNSRPFSRRTSRTPTTGPRLRGRRCSSDSSRSPRPTLLRRHLDTEGESLEHLVIRSDVGLSAETYATSADVTNALARNRRGVRVCGGLPAARRRAEGVRADGRAGLPVRRRLRRCGRRHEHRPAPRAARGGHVPRPHDRESVDRAEDDRAVHDLDASRERDRSRS